MKAKGEGPDLHNLVQSNPGVRVALLIPEPFFAAWTQLILLCDNVISSAGQMSTDPRWVVHALGIKAAKTLQSIATLAAMRQWSDALILGRSLFETELMVKWLLQSDTDARIAEYLGEISVERDRYRRKLKEGISVSAQVARDFIDRELFENDGSPLRSRGGISVRERARRTANEASYDIGYWIESLICHSHALSLSQWSPLFRKNEPGALNGQNSFMRFFDFRDKRMPCFIVMEALPMHALDTIELVDHYLGLGLRKDVDTVRETFREVVRKVSKGMVEFDSTIMPGGVKVVFEDGTETTVVPKKTGSDPLHEIP